MCGEKRNDFHLPVKSAGSETCPAHFPPCCCSCSFQSRGGREARLGLMFARYCCTDRTGSKPSDGFQFRGGALLIGTSARDFIEGLVSDSELIRIHGAVLDLDWVLMNSEAVKPLLADDVKTEELVKVKCWENWIQNETHHRRCFAATVVRRSRFLTPLPPPPSSLLHFSVSLLTSCSILFSSSLQTICSYFGSSPPLSSVCHAAAAAFSSLNLLYVLAQLSAVHSHPYRVGGESWGRIRRRMRYERSAICK
ncbi:uncharacterized protein V6R79_022337 [Siganus canaliculatus]